MTKSDMRMIEEVWGNGIPVYYQNYDDRGKPLESYKVTSIVIRGRHEHECWEHEDKDTTGLIWLEVEGSQVADKMEVRHFYTKQWLESW